MLTPPEIRLSSPVSAPAPATTTVRLRGIVFSKDRPLQLEATLASYYRRCLDAESVEMCVLYTCSDARQAAAYQTLAREYPLVRFVRETDFRADTLALCRRLDTDAGEIPVRAASDVRAHLLDGAPVCEERRRGDAQPQRCRHERAERRRDPHRRAAGRGASRLRAASGAAWWERQHP